MTIDGAPDGVDDADVIDEDEFGGMPFDDDFGDDDVAAPPRPTRGGPSYDSGRTLQARGIDYPSSTPAGMRELRSFTLARWGGANLGILAKPPRNVRAGSSPSLHNWGMAWDWRWANPGPGRSAADEAIEFFLDHASRLGIQGLHDYERCRYWKSYSGWKTGTKDARTGMGQSWAQWLHIERTWDAANDERSIDAILGGEVAARVTTPTGGSTTPSAVSTATTTAGPIEPPEPTIVQGDRGANVARLQDFLIDRGFADFTRSDGVFGPRTLAAVEALQREILRRGWYGGAVDGEYGPMSAGASKRFLTSG